MGQFLFFGASAVAEGGRLYVSDTQADKFYEIDPDTLANLSGGGVTTPGTLPDGMGGIASQLYNCDSDTDKFYEIDPDTLANLSGSGVTSPGIEPRGIGGIK